MDKGGKFTITQVLSLVLGIAVSILIILVMYNIISPVFNRGEETAASYFKLLEESLADVDKGHPADFSMWQPDDDEREYYLIYFGDNASYEFPLGDGVRKFFSLGLNKNAICVCYFEKGEGQCGECKNLELPARKNLGSGQWKIVVGEKARITKDGARENYDFSVAVVPVDVVETPLDKGLPGDGGEYIVAPGGGSIDEPAGGA